MKAAVIIPPIEDFYFSPRRFASLGTFRGTELLEEAGFEISVFDFTKGKVSQIKLPECLGYLSDYIIPGEHGSCSFFSSYKRFGSDCPNCAEVVAEAGVKEGGFDLVIISLFAFCYADTALQLGTELRKLCLQGNCNSTKAYTSTGYAQWLKPYGKIGAAGAGISVFPNYFKGVFDFVIKGEAEIFSQWIKNYIENDPDSINSVKNFFLDLNKNSDFIFPVGRYANIHTVEGDFSPSVGIASADKKNVYISVILSRGCYRKCKFCSNFITHGRNFRKSSVLELEKALLKLKPALLVHKEKKIFINIEDDNLLFDKQWFLECLDVLKSFFSVKLQVEMKIESGVGDRAQLFFSAENGFDYSFFDDEMCKLLIDNYNFRQFNFTLASSDNKIAIAQGRNSDNEKLKKILEYLGKRKISAITYFIAGLDTDSPKKCVESLLYLDSLPSLAGISMFYAVPGLLGFTDLDFFSSPFSPILCRGSSAFPWNGSLSTKELITAFRLSRTSNFFKKTALMDNFRKMGTELECKLYSLIIKNKKLFTIVNNSIEEVKNIDEKMVEMFFTKRKKTL